MLTIVKFDNYDFRLLTYLTISRMKIFKIA